MEERIVIDISYTNNIEYIIKLNPENYRSSKQLWKAIYSFIKTLTVTKGNYYFVRVQDFFVDNTIAEDSYISTLGIMFINVLTESKFEKLVKDRQENNPLSNSEFAKLLKDITPTKDAPKEQEKAPNPLIEELGKTEEKPKQKRK